MAAGPAAACTPAELRAALDEAHLPTLLMAMATLSGDATWLRDEWHPAAPRGAAEDDTGGLPPDVQAEIRAAAYELVLAWRAGKPPADPPPAAKSRSTASTTASGSIVRGGRPRFRGASET